MSLQLNDCCRILCGTAPSPSHHNTTHTHPHPSNPLFTPLPPPLNPISGGYFDSKDDMSDLPPPPPPPLNPGEADMDIEEGELPGAPGSSRPPPPPKWGAEEDEEEEEEAPKWRAPKSKDLSAQTKALLKSMGEEAYGEFFPEAGAAYTGGSDDEGDGAAAKNGAEGADGAEGEKGGEKGAGKGGKGKPMTEERKKEQKLDGQLGKIKQLFDEKGFGNDSAFKKPDRLEVGQTPARKRPRI